MQPWLPSMPSVHLQQAFYSNIEVAGDYSLVKIWCGCSHSQFVKLTSSDGEV